MIINTFSFKGFAPPLPSKKLKYNVFISFSILCLLSLSDQLIVSLSLFQCHTKAYLLVSSSSSSLKNTHARTHEIWLVCVLSLTWKSK